MPFPARNRGGQPVRISVLVRDLDRMTRKFRDGIFRYAKGRGWMVVTVECGDRYGKCFNLNSLSDERSAEAGFRMRDSDGCIFICGGRDGILTGIRRRKIPVVFLDRRRVRQNEICVTDDSESVARAAARELLSLGFEDFAYAPWPEWVDWDWPVIRGRAFSQEIRRGGGRFHQYAKGGLSDWLAALPKPCGVFAANDFVAGKVVSICEGLGIRVPDEIAVVGVDNDPQICENATTSITSVEQDVEHGGYIAAQALDSLLRPGEVTCDERCYGVKGIIHRASTRPAGDVRVAKGLEHIRLHAAERLTPDSVAKVIGCSRNLADLRFKAAVGKTVHDEIVDARVALVKEHLRNPDRMLSAIPDFCGFASAVDMRRVFKAKTGMTPREWRRTNLPPL